MGWRPLRRKTKGGLQFLCGMIRQMGLAADFQSDESQMSSGMALTDFRHSAHHLAH
jgi:hypothetical protein